MKTLTLLDVRERLATAVQRAGSLRAYADTVGVSHSYVNDVILGHRLPGPSILHVLGLERISTDPAYRAVLE